MLLIELRDKSKRLDTISLRWSILKSNTERRVEDLEGENEFFIACLIVSGSVMMVLSVLVGVCCCFCGKKKGGGRLGIVEGPR